MLTRTCAAYRPCSSLVSPTTAGQQHSISSGAADPFSRHSPRLPSSSKPPHEIKRRFAQSSASKRKILSAERQIRRSLVHQRHDIWGWVIYRTDYSDEALWSRFKHLLVTGVHRQIAKSDTPAIAKNLTWTFFDDCAAFEGATKAQLRTHFNHWVEQNWRAEQPRGELIFLPLWQRYRYFVEADQGVLESMPPATTSTDEIERALLEDRYVNFVDAQWRPLAEWSPESLEHEEVYEPIEGVTEWDVGWMRMHAYLVGAEGFHFFDDHAVWYNEYERPPEVMLY